jgi:hypothetical protein
MQKDVGTNNYFFSESTYQTAYLAACKYERYLRDHGKLIPEPPLKDPYKIRVRKQRVLKSQKTQAVV